MTNPYKTSGMTKESLISPRARTTIFSRLMDHAVVSGECLEYVGNNDHNGYGRIKCNGRQLGAHRVAYVEFIGNIPAGMVVMHSCDNPGCINPNHMSLGTVRDNVRDCINKGRFKAKGERSNYNKPLCVYNDDTSIIYKNPTIAIDNGFDKGAIYRALNGDIKTTRGFKAYYLPQATV